MRSMTGFGKGEKKTKEGRVLVELQSGNRRHLEVQVFLPRELASSEIDIKKKLGEKLFRGQVLARIFFFSEGSFSLLPQLKKLKAVWLDLAQKLAFPKEEITLSFLMDQVSHQEEAPLSIKKAMEDALEDALESLIAMKEKEGKVIEKEIKQRLSHLEKKIREIEKIEPEGRKRVEARIREKVALFNDLEDHEERLHRELVFLIDKSDITEEILRFKSHLSQWEDVWKEKESVGKKMDFIVQEMVREINTIGSKALETSITKIVIEVKSELEKIREQIQNIE